MNPAAFADQGAVPADWNKSSDGYCFQYKHADVSKPVVFKLLRMENVLLAHAAKKDEDKVHSMEIK